jgi:hypothetical protein
MSKKGSHSDDQNTLFGVACNSRSQWPKLLASSADRQVLVATYDGWVSVYNSTVSKLGAMGGRWVQVLIDIDELVAWCAQRWRPLNGAARAEFTA